MTMFESDLWNEIRNTLGHNKVRSFLTAFGVGWGIFMLIVMLGAGNGLSNGVNRAFAGWANNSCFVWTQTTPGTRCGCAGAPTAIGRLARRR